jgi:transcription initiation factor IIE alpha subunit
MKVPRKLKEAFEFDYVCVDCGKRLREGDSFTITGTMSGTILRGCITNTRRQIDFLGRLRCEACAKALSQPPSG